ncbi:hypothetical protein Q5Y75_23730 [Ruegeria sp. 2205SS24-7]|uniref:DUF6603 domain-containing protein n=1 Tax=Ruegeria discodermiae TaxID=3064389 RepID=UPI0027423938|nr:DUF6603 domain-containing protein [Ruegeria sp. 2205SS24-7]MDP5220206.1 hypothetical protein [Ruegeria sp. 2205SS24-7]
MSDQFLDDMLALASRILSPLSDAAQSTTSLRAFLDDFGWRAAALDDAVLGRFTAVGSAVDGLSDAVSDGEGQMVALQSAVAALHNLGDLPPMGQMDHPFDEAAFWQSLPEDVLALLLFEGLAEETPGFFGILTFLGVLQRKPEPADATTGRLVYDKRIVDWGALARALSAPDQILPEVYGWGGTFDHATFLDALEGALSGLGATASVSRAGPDVLRPEVTADNPHAIDMKLLTAMPPITFRPGDGTQIKPAILMTPLPPDGQPSGAPTGFALSPTVFGGAAASIGIPDNDSPVTLALAGDFATAPLRVGVSPDGVRMLSSRTDINVIADIVWDTVDAPILVLGRPEATRLELRGAGLGLGIAGAPSDPEFTLHGEIEDAVIYLGAGEGDGLLNKILEAIELEIPFEAGLNWSNKSGLEISGGLGLSFVIPIDKTLANVLTLDQVNISLYGDLTEQATVMTATVDGSLQLGPLFAGAEGVGVKATVTPRSSADPGNLGSAQIDFGFQPPSGYALSLNADPITGGGYISVSDHEYRGAMALQFENFGFSAFAILTTQMPDGEPGFSFAGSIFAEFTVPLAFGFFLTGVGGFIGINRTIDTDAMREVLFDGRLDGLLFPPDPIESAGQILDDMALIMPAEEGQHIVGPCVRISWGQPSLIHITMGVLLEFGQDVRIVILGGVSMILPDEDKVLVSLKLQFMGEIDFTAGTIDFDATLEGSRVLTFAVDGDVAIRTGWGKNIKQVASFGGLHPDYPKPDNLPDLARLSISFGGNNPRLTFSAYQAITYNSLQVGARADMYAQGPKVPLLGRVAADGYVAFDALIYFNPFSFQVSLRGSLRILVDGKDKASLYFSIELHGPNTWYINGEVWVKVLGIKVRFAVEHRWGQRETIETFVASAVDLLRDAVERSEGFQPVEQSGAVPAVSFRTLADEDKPVDPLGGLRFMQSAVPLQITLQKIGEADVSGPADVDIRVLNNGTPLDMVPAEAEFVRGHFFSISDAQRLSDPVFELHKAGFQFSDDAMVSGPALVEDEYAYEIIEIPLHDSDQPARIHQAALSSATFTRVSAGTLHRDLRGMTAQKAQLVSSAPVTVAQTSFVTEDVVAGLQSKVTRGGSLRILIQEVDAVSPSLTAQRETTDDIPVASYIAA